MDADEVMAWDLEYCQTERYRKHPNKDKFWTKIEVEIHKTIMLFRVNSITYSPNNQR